MFGINEKKPEATMTGGRGLKDDERTYKVVESSFNVLGGVYRGMTMNAAAQKAGRQQFKRNGNNGAMMVRFVLQETTRARGSKRAKPQPFKMTRTKKTGQPKTMTFKGQTFELGTWDYELERLERPASATRGGANPIDSMVKKFTGGAALDTLTSSMKNMMSGGSSALEKKPAMAGGRRVKRGGSSDNPDAPTYDL